MKKRYYPSPMLDTALYYLQNHPEARTLGPKKLVEEIEVDGLPIGRGAWEQAKRLLATESEPRNLITVDLTTRFIGYVGSRSRLVGYAAKREHLNAKLRVLIGLGWSEVFHSPDKQFYVYAAPAKESEQAA